MRICKSALLFICILSLSGCKDTAVQQGSDHYKIDFAQLNSGWVLINYWDTWCHSCKEEIPMLNQFYQAHKNSMQLYGVNYSELQGNALNKAINQFQIKFPVLVKNPLAKLHLKPLKVVPVTYVMHNGKVVKTLLGPQTNKTLSDAIA